MIRARGVLEILVPTFQRKFPRVNIDTYLSEDASIICDPHFESGFFTIQRGNEHLCSSLEMEAVVHLKEVEPEFILDESQTELQEGHVLPTINETFS